MSIETDDHSAVFNYPIAASEPNVNDHIGSGSTGAGSVMSKFIPIPVHCQYKSTGERLENWYNPESFEVSPQDIQVVGTKVHTLQCQG